MTTNLDAASELFLANLGRIQQRLADANRQVSSGKRISEPSDAPDQIDSLLQMRADRLHNQQIQSNLALANTDAQTADGTLNSAIQLMDRALVLGDQGANSTLDTAGRQSLAQEVQSLLDEMVSCSQTTVEGRYIFSGDQDQLPSYAADPTAANGVVQLTAAAASRQIEDPAGGSFTASKTAQEIFDAKYADGTVAVGNVFAALSGLHAALLSDNAQNVAQALTSVQSASDHLNSIQAFYGNVESRIQNAQSFSSSYDTRLQTQISQTEDADVTAAALELSQGGIQLQAAFQMQAAMPRETLFKYLG